MRASAGRNQAHLGIAVCAGLLLCTLSVGCGDELYAMSELYEIDGGTRQHALSSCTPLGERGSTPSAQGGPAGSRDLVVKHDIVGDSLLVVVTSDDDELARRKYGEKQLASGERDEFTVTTHAGRTYELTYWGGRECEPPESE